jgi:hypothetical protein
MYLYLGILKQMSSEHKMRDVKLQRIQNILGKVTCPLLYLLNPFVEKSSKNEGMSKEEIKSTTQLCKDVYQLVQVTYSDITFRGRTFVKDDLQDRYKGICNENTPVTDQLFGDDIKEKVKELDTELSIGRKIGKNNREPGERTRRSFVPNNRGGRRFGRKHFTNRSSRNDNNDRKKFFLDKTGFKKKKYRKPFLQKEQDETCQRKIHV